MKLDPRAMIALTMMTACSVGTGDPAVGSNDSDLTGAPATLPACTIVRAFEATNIDAFYWSNEGVPAAVLAAAAGRPVSRAQLAMVGLVFAVELGPNQFALFDASGRALVSGDAVKREWSSADGARLACAGDDGAGCREEGSGEDEAHPEPLPPIDDCGDTSIAMKRAASPSPRFYALSATDRGLSAAHPTGCAQNTSFENKTDGMELCVFVTCANAARTATRCEDGAPATSASGVQGCCITGRGRATPTYDCPGSNTSESASFLLRVRRRSFSMTCLPFEVDYRF